MNVKYKGIGRKSVAGLLLCLMGVLTACEDDFGKNGTNSGVLTMKVEVPEGWTSGVAVDEEAPDSRCVSVDAAASESSIPLYLHTIESDNTVAVPSTRGALKTMVEKFSMSAICYEKEGVDISELTPNFAYDLTCTVGSGGTVSCPERLLWPANGNVRFFAFALLDDSSKPFELSGGEKKGAPTITYTVPNEVADQHDLMAACTDAKSATVDLNFRHILTAVKIVTAKDMIPGTITEVKFSGIPNKGTYTPAPTLSNDLVDKGTWQIEETSEKGVYTVTHEVTIEGDYKGYEDNIVGADEGGEEIIGETGNLTLLMIPQTLPEGAKLEVTFKEALSKHEFTLSADLEGKTWPAGKIVTYSISPSSIHIKPVVEFNKKPGVEEDMLPYSGVWHDVKVRAYAEVTKGVATQYVKLPAPTIEYKFADGTTYTQGNFYDPDGNDWPTTAATESSDAITLLSDITADEGMYVLKAQDDFEKLQKEFGEENLKEFEGSKDNPSSLLYEKSDYKSANCYMVGQPGYYKFPAVYGNTYKGGNYDKTGVNLTTTTNGMQYYPDWKGEKINEENYDISKNGSIGIEDLDAVLAWQDAPDLIDNVELMSEKENGVFWVKFRVRKHSITQGNALIVARKKNSDGTKTIVWSWHIWVSQHTQAWMMKNNCSEVKSIYRDANNGNKYKFTGKKYQLADVNLGYCDPHAGNDGRNFKIKFKVKVNNSEIEVTKYIAGEKTIDTKEAEFKQAEFKGSLAGDNTYYQWGRSAPTPGGIYNKNTPMYYYYKKGDISKAADYAELTMENKPLFYEGEKSYGLTSSANFTTGGFDGEKGVTIPWAIQHPYVFIMSKYFSDTDDSENFRDHWHKPITNDELKYASGVGSHLFQMWNPIATKVVDDVNEPEEDVAKSVYDPCPAGYVVPPANLFSAFAYEKNANGYGECKLYDSENNSIGYTTSITKLSDNMEWDITVGTKTFSFPATGVRNKSLRSNEFGKITCHFGTGAYASATSYPAFRMLTYVSSSTMGKGNQIPIFYIDNRYEAGKNIYSKDNMNKLSETPGIGSYHKSSNSYGLSVRPMKDL